MQAQINSSDISKSYDKEPLHKNNIQVSQITDAKLGTLSLKIVAQNFNIHAFNIH